MAPEERPILGKLAVFLIGRSINNLATTGVVEVRTGKSAPSCPAVIPKQKIIKMTNDP